MTGQPSVIATRSSLLRFAGWLALTLVAALICYAADVRMILALLLAAGILVALMAHPDLTTLFVMFALYANLVVVAIHFSKVPEPVAVCFFLVTAHNFSHGWIARAEPR